MSIIRQKPCIKDIIAKMSGDDQKTLKDIIDSPLPINVVASWDNIPATNVTPVLFTIDITRKNIVSILVNEPGVQTVLICYSEYNPVYGDNQFYQTINIYFLNLTNRTWSLCNQFCTIAELRSELDDNAEKASNYFNYPKFVLDTSGTGTHYLSGPSGTAAKDHEILSQLGSFNSCWIEVAASLGNHKYYKLVEIDTDYMVYAGSENSIKILINNTPTERVQFQVLASSLAILNNAITNGGIGWKESGSGQTITWNGSITGRDSTVIGDMTFYKVSGTPIARQDLIGATLKFNHGLEVTLTSEHLLGWADLIGSVPEGASENDILVNITDSLYVLIMNNDATIILEEEIPVYLHRGVSFDYLNDEGDIQYISQLSYGSQGTTHKIAKDLLSIEGVDGITTSLGTNNLEIGLDFEDSDLGKYLKIGTTGPIWSGLPTNVTASYLTIPSIDRIQKADNSPLFWHGTQAQYDAIATKDADTLYIIVPDSNA